MHCDHVIVKASPSCQYPKYRCTRITTFIKAKPKKSEGKKFIANIEFLRIKYYIILFKSKNLIYYVIKKLKNNIRIKGRIGNDYY